MRRAPAQLQVIIIERSAARFFELSDKLIELSAIAITVVSADHDEEGQPAGSQAGARLRAQRSKAGACQTPARAMREPTRCGSRSNASPTTPVCIASPR